MHLSMGRTFLLLLLTTLCVSSTSACRCPPLELEEYYDTSDTVVEAYVLAVNPSPCPITGCIPGAERITYTLAVTALFKDCAPLSLLFFADTSTSSSECGIKLDEGETWLLFLQDASPSSPGAGPGDVSQINTCQGNRLITSVSEAERDWLEDAATKPENACADDVTALGSGPMVAPTAAP